MDCTSYTTYRLKSIDEVMAALGMSDKEQAMVKEKYLAIRYDFLIGFNSVSEVGGYYALFSGDLTWPVSGHHFISSPYGMRIHPTLGTLRMHYGIDIPAPAYTNVVAAAGGKVQSVQWSDAVGWTIVIDHGEDESGRRIVTRYLHMMNAKVNAGQEVQAGQVICEVGDEVNMGYLSTGSHLHLEVMADGVNHDPAIFFHRLS